jgi:hypothetical protein
VLQSHYPESGQQWHPLTQTPPGTGRNHQTPPRSMYQNTTKINVSKHHQDQCIKTPPRSMYQNTIKINVSKHHQDQCIKTPPRSMYQK